MAEENKQEDQNTLMPKKYSSLAADADALQQEVDQLENTRNQQNQQAEDDKNKQTEESDEDLSAEERTFKQRYSDLRRHQQKEKERLEARIEELESQVQQKAQEEPSIPTTEEELEAWANNYPDLYNVIQAVADKRAQQRDTELDTRLKTVEERERQTEMQKALNEIKETHPDFDELRESDEFHEWAETQATWVQQALYENETDPTPVIDVIDLYKARNNKRAQKNKNKQGEREAASPVKTSQRQEEPAQPSGYQFKESDLANMNPAEFEKNLDAINKAQREGKILYDLSGDDRAAAR